MLNYPRFNVCPIEYNPFVRQGKKRVYYVLRIAYCVLRIAYFSLITL